MSTDWTFKNTYFLLLMTFGYIIGEIAHFLLGTVSKSVARDIHYGDHACYTNASIADNKANCSKIDETECKAKEGCEWNWSGLGIEYQILAGPAFIAVFTIMGLCMGFLSDRLYKLGRNRIMAFGVALFSTSCFLMGFSTSYWQLILLRMGIAAGEAVCRPTSGAMIADIFSADARGVANGIFSWGVYYGYGLAFVIGIQLTALDIMDYSWRAPFVLSAIPGFVISVLLFVTVKDPKMDGEASSSYKVTEATGSDDDADETASKDSLTTSEYTRLLLKSFLNPSMLLLLLAAAVRHTAGFSWAYNTTLYFQEYYPDFVITYWILGCSVGGGSFGVFFGGWFSDRLVKRLGLHSRMWILSAFQILATPFAAGVLYFKPPYCMVSLLIYYFCAETWFAILFTVIVEICSPEVKSTSIAVFLFIMNNIGGNLPVVVNPIRKAVGYQEALFVFWPGMVLLSGILFFVASIPLYRQSRRSTT